jgi:hypothetical protein
MNVLRGKTGVNDGFFVAMFDYQRVFHRIFMRILVGWDWGHSWEINGICNQPISMD